jgi:hypothetical protein
MLVALTRFNLKMKEQIARSDALYSILTQYHVEYQKMCKTNPSQNQINDFLKRRQDAISQFLENKV